MSILVLITADPFHSAQIFTSAVSPSPPSTLFYLGSDDMMMLLTTPHNFIYIQRFMQYI